VAAFLSHHWNNKMGLISELDMFRQPQAEVRGGLEVGRCLAAQPQCKGAWRGVFETSRDNQPTFWLSKKQLFVPIS
jgi:hypothetical protein